MTTEPPSSRPLWHHLSVGETQRSLNVDAGRGLSAAEAQARLQQHGPNRLPESRRIGPLQRFLQQFNNVLIYVLLGAAVVTALLGHWVDTAVILGVVVINAFVGFLQEGKAEKAMEAIRGMLSLQAGVTRDGQRVLVPAEQLVPGDVVHLQSGDKVPADVRLVEARSLRIDESALTGESVPVEKSVNAVDADAALGDRLSLAFSGTVVTYGQGTAVVVGTGAHTELGRINALMAAAPTMATPLLRQVAKFGQVLTLVILGLAVAVGVFGLVVRDYAWSDLFLAVVGLAVAAIPEGLPAIMTITLAIGVQAMARRRAIIRRLPAVETLGAVTVICSDKTGTLTRNEMTVTSVVTADHLYTLAGVGYEPEGHFSVEVENVDPADHPPLLDLARVALLCNDSRLREQDGWWQVEGDPTEGALLSLAGKAGLKLEGETQRFPRLDAIPFESEHKFMASLHAGPAGHVVLLKGAPERVMDRCGYQRGRGGDAPLDPAYWARALEHIAARGERLLALALKTVPAHQTQLAFDDVREGFVLLGLAGIIDPPRDEAIAAIRRCHAAGITVKMITGDHGRTAAAIAAQIGLGRGAAVTGAELERISDADLPDVVAKSHVFARTSPEHKLRLVKALQSRGHVVAMTGDGVNDAPALKSADVGIAMGIKGTEAAKEAAAMVLADDNFSSIADAVEEGRTVYDNLKKAILFILPTNGAQALVVMIAILFGLTLPLTPAQVLWVNMISAVTLGLALAFEPPETNVMRRPPRNPREPLLPPLFLWRIGFVSVLIMMGTMAVFQWTLVQTGEVEAARTAAVGTLIFGQICYLLNSRFITGTSLRRDLLTGNPYVIYASGLVLLAQLLFTYLPAMNRWFASTPIGLATWLPLLVVGGLIFAAVEVEKTLWRARRRSAS